MSVTNIRRAMASDASRICEIVVTNYRINFYPFFKDERYYFGELNVADMAAEYADGSKALADTFVYDDGVVKGMIRISGSEAEKLFVEPTFQGQGIGARLLNFAVAEKNVRQLWVLEYNTRGIAFYRREGFLLTDEKRIEDECVPLRKMILNEPRDEVSLRIISEDAPDRALLDEINEEAFPESERCPIDGLYRSGRDGALDMIGIYSGGGLAGFFAVRRFEKIRYIAYFAVCAEKRSMGIGGRALRLLRDFYSGDFTIFTEFEAPDEDCANNAERLRRRNFYLRNGFFETGWYSSYGGTEFALACSDPEFDKPSFDRFVSYLRSIVSDFIPLLYQK